MTKSARLLGSRCSFVVIVAAVAPGNRSMAAAGGVIVAEGGSGAGTEADDTAGEMGIACD